MLATTARVEMGRLYHAQTGPQPTIVGTVAWYNWLEQHRDFTFVDRLSGTFLAYKRNTASGILTWEASLVRAGKRYRLALGPSQTLSLSRLQSVAQTLARADLPAEGVPLSPAAPASPLPALQPVNPVSSPSSLLRTKVSVPRSSPDVIPRPHLLERLSAGLGGRVTLVCAPAGFGKTTLVVEWVKTLQRQVAWLSLDESDDELPVFVHALVAALQSAVPDGLGALASLFTAPQFPAPAEVASLLSSDLADVAQDLVVVLDDYHLLHNAEVHALLEELISQLPCQVHLVLAARADPPLPLVPWQAKGWLSELRGSDLRFTRQETEAYLAHVLGEEQAEQLAGPMEDWTDGWIAVVRLLAFSLRTAPQPAAILDRLHSQPDGLVSEYLLEEILGQQAPEVQEVLLRTSLLEQFCAELCAALLGSSASAAQVGATLSWLEHTNAFLIPLDEHQQWYRFHPLFKLLLHQRLQARSSHEELAALHRRASAWYAGQGLIDEAIKHALAAGDGSGAAQLVEAQVLRAYEQEQMVQLEGWLRLLPKEQIQGSPRLLFARIWILQAQGRVTDLPPLLTTVEHLLDAHESSPPDAADEQTRHTRILRALLAIGWSNFHYFTGQAQASLESARTALQWLPPGETYVISHAHYFLALASKATGQEEVALNTALQDSSAHPNTIARLLFAQAILYLMAGKLPQVEQTARHLLRVAQHNELALSQNYAHWLLGMVDYEGNRLDWAAYHFSIVLANQHRADFWTVRDALCGLALAYQAQGLSKEAHETTEVLLDWVQDQQNVHELVTAYTFCGQLALVRDEVEKAEQWLELAGKKADQGPMLYLEEPAFTHAWLLLARGEAASVAQGQALLVTLLEHVEAVHNTRKTIQVLALQAWAYDLQGREAQALESLERALVLARPGGFIRSFADVPGIVRVLQELRKRRKTQQGGHLDAYLQHILVAMHPMAAQAGSTEALLQHKGLEALTERELHILRLLDKDLNNKEIARELVVTPGTVKVHTNNLYRKLSVNNRRAAVILAKSLDLLPAS